MSIVLAAILAAFAGPSAPAEARKPSEGLADDQRQADRPLRLSVSVMEPARLLAAAAAPWRRTTRQAR